MTGIEAQRTQTGYPYPGGPIVDFTCEDVAALGKVSVYGDAVIRLLVRLRDGREVCVKGTEQDAADRKWLYKTGRKLGAPTPPRWDIAIAWLDLPT